MVNKSPRTRSNALPEFLTSVGFDSRPKSSQSTASAASNTTQLTQAQVTDISYPLQNQVSSMVWQNHGASMDQSTYHFSQPNGAYSVNPNLQQHAHTPFGHDIGLQQNPVMRMQSPAQFTSIEGREDSIVDDRVSVKEETVGDGSQRKKGSASSQANDNELRRLFRENQGRELHDVALQVVKDEKGPRSEKAKQIFGMLWYES